jgi:hypothetical protein
MFYLIRKIFKRVGNAYLKELFGGQEEQRQEVTICTFQT